MKINKPFQTSKKPKVPYPFLMPVEWGGSLAFLARAHGGKIARHNCEGLRPPFLLLSNHASMIDFPMAVKATFPHRCNWVISIEEFVGREWLFRGIGGIYKRKFTADVTVIRHLMTVLRKRKMSCVMYPEARYSLAGINERISDAIGQFVKAVKCPVAVLIEHGNFICHPQWSSSGTHRNPVSADLTQIVTGEEVATLSADEIQKRIVDAFCYDDYQWQYDNQIAIRSKKRADSIHRILYQCPVCQKEYATDSKGTHLWCNACGSRWEMDVFGKLHCLTGEDTFTHVPDWYRWERENVRREVRSGQYHFEDTVRLEHLDNCKKGFRAIGNVRLTHDEDGFRMDGILDNGEHFTFHRTVSSMESCHIEYDFHKRGVKERGPAIDLCNLTDTYFVFPLNAPNPLTKIHFATEELHDWEKEKEAALATVSAASLSEQRPAHNA